MGNNPRKVTSAFRGWSPLPLVAALQSTLSRRFGDWDRRDDEDEQDLCKRKSTYFIHSTPAGFVATCEFL